jgi:hypothetical protein
MSAIDHLIASDTLRFAPISFHLHPPIGADSDSSTMAFCVPKRPLAFHLTSEVIGIGIPGLTIPFTGVLGDDSSITWSADQPFTDIAFGGIPITRVHGQIVTRVDEATASLGMTCAGEQRVFEATMRTIGERERNTLTIATGVGDAILSDIRTSAPAMAGQRVAPIFFDVVVHANRTPHDGCGNYFQLQGSTVRFTASIANLRSVGHVTDTSFAWAAPDSVTVSGRRDQPTLEVTLDSPGPVTLNVYATVTTDLEGAQTEHATVHFAVLTPEEARLQSLLCTMVTVASELPVAKAGIGASVIIGGFTVIDPLRDPTPDKMRFNASALLRGYSLVELNEVRAAADRIASVADGVAKQTSQIIKQQEAQKEVTPGR